MSINSHIEEIQWPLIVAEILIDEIRSGWRNVMLYICFPYAYLMYIYLPF